MHNRCKDRHGVVKISFNTHTHKQCFFSLCIHPSYSFDEAQIVYVLWVCLEYTELLHTSAASQAEGKQVYVYKWGK